MNKLNELLDQEGMTMEEFLEEYALDSMVPGICMNDGCDYSTCYEPDQSEGWCDNCQTNTVCSALVLLGVI